MFGYVAADRAALTDGQLQRYKGCYCGLCHAIGQAYGSLRRAALDYDITFLVLLLSSLYEPEEAGGEARCLVHPVRRHAYWQTEATDYGAAMNMALAYHNCMDNWHDDRSIAGLAEAALFRKSAQAAARAYPRQWAAMEDCLATLSKIEADNLQDPDAGANAFGNLMGELFVWREDRWQPQLRQMGQALGRYIYLLYAVLDLPEDQKRKRYNPLSELADHGYQKEDFKPILTMCMGECTEAFEQLPLVQDVDLLRNILYSGVWTRFYWKNGAPNKEA